MRCVLCLGLVGAAAASAASGAASSTLVTREVIPPTPPSLPPLDSARRKEGPFARLLSNLMRGGRDGTEDTGGSPPSSPFGESSDEPDIATESNCALQETEPPLRHGSAAKAAFAGLQVALESPLGGLARTLVLMVVGIQLLTSLVKDIEGPDALSREALARRCASTGLSPEVIPTLNRHELAVAADLVDASALDVSYDDIAGMEDVKAAAQELILDPWEFPTLYRSQLLRRPTGILLYGPPGCGKTMLAKAIARESGACCIAVSPSTLLRKYVGESNLMTRALFSLAKKIQPCIIFVDEVDGIAFRRSDTDATPVRDVSTEFMSLWDGLQTGDDKVVVLAATNRPWDLDPAAQRRFGRSFLVGLPDVAQRRGVLAKALREVPLEKGFDINAIAAATEGYSCSDLVDLCREAVRTPLREVKARLRKTAAGAAAAAGAGGSWREAARAAAAAGSGRSGAAAPELRLRPLRTTDVLEAQQRVVPSFVAAEAYRASLDEYRSSLIDQFRGGGRWN